MTRTLSLAADLKIPVAAVSRTFGILAVRGAGKSNTAAVMAEEMFESGLPFVVVDPVGSWWGLRSSANGKAAGLPIPIFGGKHGDVPLERGAGDLIADLIVDKRLTCVLDLSGFDSEGDKKAFLLAFARRLYHRNEDPLHLFLEEADDYIPQKPFRDEAQLLRAWENIVRRGRARGLGITLITQRSASVNKMVLTQVETLFAMRTTGPQDVAAIKAWVQYHQVGVSLLSSLASLEDGEAWVWSPHFLKTVSRHQIRRRGTFDSGATPDNLTGPRRTPATLADIDVDGLRKQMAFMGERTPKGKGKGRPSEVQRSENVSAAGRTSALRMQGQPDASVLLPVRPHDGVPLPADVQGGAVLAPAAVRPGGLRGGIVTKDEAARLTRENGQLKAEVQRLTNANQDLLERVMALEGGAVIARPAGEVQRTAQTSPSAAGIDDEPPAPSNGAVDDRLYQAIKSRLLDDAPALVRLLATRPEIEVQVTRKTLTLDEFSLKGRIARLLKDGFFQEARGCGPVRTALKRTGPDANTANIGRALADLTRDGFVTDEDSGYREVPGMVVNIVEGS